MRREAPAVESRPSLTQNHLTPDLRTGESRERFEEPLQAL